MSEQPDRPIPPIIDPPRLDRFGRPLLEPGTGGPLRPRTAERTPLDQLRLVALGLVDNQARDELLGGRRLEKIYSVPRRFDLATLFVVSTAFGMFFTILGFAGLSSTSKLLWCAYISLVGTAQAMLYGGRAPRLASVMTGSLLLALGSCVFASRDWAANVCLFLGSSMIGLFGGYITGTVVGGVFLVADHVRKWWERRSAFARVERAA